MKNYSGYGSEGGKYETGLNIKDIAKQVRAEIKKAMPGFKYSVTLQRFSMGQSLSVYMVSAPEGFTFVEPNPDYWDGGFGQDGEVWNTTKQYQKAQAKAEAITNAYNYDDSDSMIDYFDVNFYAHFGRTWNGEADKLYSEQVAAVKAAALQAA